MRYAAAVFAALLLPVTLSTSVLSQTAGPGSADPRITGAVIEGQSNTTGNDGDVVVAPGATGGEIINTDAAAGGASHPERAVPNGSGGGGQGGG